MSKQIFIRKEGLNTLVDVLESINCNFDAEQVPIAQNKDKGAGDNWDYGDNIEPIPGYSCIRRGDNKTHKQPKSQLGRT